MVDNDLLHFLKKQRLLTISTINKKDPWICNIYFSVDKDFNFFFVGPPDSNHSQHIARNPKVAFNTAWFDPKNLANRKAIQAIGECTRISDVATIGKFLRNHHKYYPLWKSIITQKKMREHAIKSRPYVIKPSYIKFWNDELYGDEGTKEFKL